MFSAIDPVSSWSSCTLGFYLDRVLVQASEYPEKRKPDVESCRISNIMARLGAKETDIALAVNVRIETLRAWKYGNAHFAQALQEGTEFLNSALEDALLQRAIGYRYPEEEVICDREGNVFRRYVPKDVLPSIEAGKLWRKAHPSADLQDAVSRMRRRRNSDDILARHIRALAAN